GSAPRARRPGAAPARLGRRAEAGADPLAAWCELAADASRRFREPVDAEPVLEQLMRAFPGLQGQCADHLMRGERWPAREGRPRRDLLPLPCPDLEVEDFAGGGDLCPDDRGALQPRLRVAVMALNWEVKPSAVQWAALRGLARRLCASLASEPAIDCEIDWAAKLKGRRISYDGSEVSTPHGLALKQCELLAARGARPLNLACEKGAGLISAFSGIDGARRALEILVLVPACRLSFETDAGAVRAAGRAFAATARSGDARFADPVGLARRLRSRGGIVGVLVVGGFPYQGRAVLNVDRKGGAGPRSQMVGHVMRMAEVQAGFLGENAPSMAEAEALELGRMFGCVPVMIEAVDLGWARRQRRCWVSWDLLPTFEAEMSEAPSSCGSMRRFCQVKLAATLPPVSEWPAGLKACLATQLRHAGSGAGTASTGQTGGSSRRLAGAREVLMGLPRGRAAPCVASAQVRSAPEKFVAMRQSFLGNSFQREVVAWLLAQWAAQAELLVAVPSLAALHESSRGWAGGERLWAGDLATLRGGREAVAAETAERLRAARTADGERLQGSRDCALVLESAPQDGEKLVYVGQALGGLRGGRLPCRCVPTEPRRAGVLLAALAEQGAGGWRPFSNEQRVVAGLVAACHRNGADLRVDTNSEILGNTFPRQEVDAGIWSWRTARQLVLQDSQPHIDVL
ncbi:unnamed protein product, partial [Prorocentrum cordatum]